MKVYGKKRRPDLTAAFRDLRLSASPKNLDGDECWARREEERKIMGKAQTWEDRERRPLGLRSKNIQVGGGDVVSKGKCESDCGEVGKGQETEKRKGDVLKVDIEGVDDGSDELKIMPLRNVDGGALVVEKTVVKVVDRTEVLKEDESLVLREKNPPSVDSSTTVLDGLSMNNEKISVSTTVITPISEKDTSLRRPRGTTKAIRSTRPKNGNTQHEVSRQLILNDETVAYLTALTAMEGVSSEIKSTDQWYDTWSLHCNVNKIAEGSYGSVFRLSDKGGLEAATIGKLMPLKPRSGKGSKNVGNTLVADAASEIKLLETMSHVPGFVEFRNAEVLIGGLPKPLRKEYRTWHARRKANNRSTELICRTVYPESQAWVFIEMGDAGTELEDALRLETEENRLVKIDDQGKETLDVRVAADTFWGVAEALANGEAMQEFEHRDLHFSNICVKRRRKETINEYLLAPSISQIEVTLIDYTLSRATLEDGTIVANGMNDECLFQGDNDLQFDIYRWMRNAMPAKNSDDKDWNAFVPISNVLWLYHLLEKLLRLCPRPKQIQEEQKLWDSLKELQTHLVPRDGRTKKCCSATDVISYASQGTSEFKKGPEEAEDREVDGEIKMDGLVSRFKYVAI